MRTNVYIDGFNFYYGCVKGTDCRWLDFGAFCRLMLPRNDVRTIKYFTALVDGRSDSDRPTRQLTYLRALKTIPSFEIHLGQFLTKKVRMPLADGSGTVQVLRTEEKGSDVNLAVHMLNDAHRGVIDCAVIVSNDSDLCEPLRIVREELGIVVGWLPPTTNGNRRLSVELRKHVNFIREIRRASLKKCQFPEPVVDSIGAIAKPSGW